MTRERQIAAAECRVASARVALSKLYHDPDRAYLASCFGQEEIVLKRKELADAQAALYALRMEPVVTSSAWKLAYIA